MFSKGVAGSNMFEKIKAFLKDAAVELRKVSWPTRRETVNSTVVVIALILMLGVFLAIIDGALAKIMGIIIG